MLDYLQHIYCFVASTYIFNHIHIIYMYRGMAGYIGWATLKSQKNEQKHMSCHQDLMEIWQNICNIPCSCLLCTCVYMSTFDLLIYSFIYNSYIYIYVRRYIEIDVCMYIYIYIDIEIDVCMYIYIYLLRWMYVYIYIYWDGCMYVCMYIYIYWDGCLSIHIYLHTCLVVHTHKSQNHKERPN